MDDLKAGGGESGTDQVVRDGGRAGGKRWLELEDIWGWGWTPSAVVMSRNL